MTASITLIYMSAPMTTRQFAGSVVMDEIARGSGGPRTIARFANVAELDRKTIYNVRDGKTVGPMVLRTLEGALNMPTRLLDYVIDGDIKRIERLEGLRPDLRQYIVDALGSMAEPPMRRSTDRRAAR